MNGIGQITIDLQSWPVTPGKVSPCLAILIQAYKGTLFQCVVNALGQPTRAQRLCCQRTDPPPLSLCCLQCGQNIGAKKAPVVLKLLKCRDQCCFAHGFEQAKGLSAGIGEPVRPGWLEQHQSLQFKSAIDIFLRFILYQSTHSVPRGLTGRKLMQSKEMCCGYEYVALPFLFTRTRSDSSRAFHRRGTPTEIRHQPEGCSDQEKHREL